MQIEKRVTGPRIEIEQTCKMLVKLNVKGQTKRRKTGCSDVYHKV